MLPNRENLLPKNKMFLEKIQKHCFFSKKQDSFRKKMFRVYTEGETFSETCSLNNASSFGLGGGGLDFCFYGKIEGKIGLLAACYSFDVGVKTCLTQKLILKRRKQKQN